MTKRTCRNSISSLSWIFNIRFASIFVMLHPRDSLTILHALHLNALGLKAETHVLQSLHGNPSDTVDPHQPELSNTLTCFLLITRMNDGCTTRSDIFTCVSPCFGVGIAFSGICCNAFFWNFIVDDLFDTWIGHNADQVCTKSAELVIYRWI